MLQFQNESSRDTTLMKMCDLHKYGRVGETQFHMNGFARRLALKNRQRVTRKWPLFCESVSLSLTTQGNPAMNTVMVKVMAKGTISNVILLALCTFSGLQSRTGFVISQLEKCMHVGIARSSAESVLKSSTKLSLIASAFQISPVRTLIDNKN